MKKDEAIAKAVFALDTRQRVQYVIRRGSEYKVCDSLDTVPRGYSVAEMIGPGNVNNYRAADKEKVVMIQRLTQALKDIINAAGNGEPYTPEELERAFGPDYNAGYEMLVKLGVPEGDGNPTVRVR